MNKAYKNIIWLLFSLAFFLHIFIFIKGISLSDEINFYEHETKKFHQENLELAKEAVSLDSLQYAASMAAVLDFTKISQPIYLDDVKYARK